MYFYNVYKCPSCGETLAENGDIQKHFCVKCGTVMIIDRRVECLDNEEKKAQENQKNQDLKQINEEILGAETQENLSIAPEEIEVNKKTVRINLNGEVFDAELPIGTFLRKQNPECSKVGKICSIMDGQLICLVPIEQKKDADGNTSLFDVALCHKNPSKNLQFNEVGKNE